MSDSSILRIGTRGSQLARWQATWVADRLRESGVDVEIIRIETTGDVTSGALSQFGGVGVFTKEIQRALAGHAVDIAVHSLKDLPTEPTPGLVLAAIPLRETNRDAWIASSGLTLQELPKESRIGTGSPRRQAQVLHMRSDLQIHDIRGNVETRLAKVARGEFDATILAEAGLKRLGLEHHITQRFSLKEFLPAVGQGALGIEVREDDVSTRAIVQRLHDANSGAAVTAERSLLRALRAGCLAPVGAHAFVAENRFQMHAVVLSADGKRRVDVHGEGRIDQPEELGNRLAAKLLQEGADRLLSR